MVGLAQRERFEVMKFAKFAAAGLAAVMYATSFQPAQAAFVAKPVPLVGGQSEAGVVDVRHRRYHRRRHRRGAAIAGGLIAGALIGGAIASSRNRYYGDPYYAPRRVYRRRHYEPRRVYRRHRGDAHTSWCYDRYRSYRAYDDTFQPYHGPRRRCWSPYN